MEITTARALEIVLSRIRMSPQTARDLAFALEAERRRFYEQESDLWD